jgi:hypothetical protein
VEGVKAHVPRQVAVQVSQGLNISHWDDREGVGHALSHLGVQQPVFTSVCVCLFVCVCECACACVCVCVLD